MLINTPASDWIALVILVFTLGARHGLDADHIVAIDGLTRFNAIHNPRLARWCGLIFSLGHSVAVILIVTAAAALGAAFRFPGWVEDFGAWASILLLISLGVINLLAVIQTRSDAPVQLVSSKGRFLGRLQRTTNPTVVAFIGAIFAASFDTITLAVFFAASGVRSGGLEHCLILGALFAAGMILIDTCNGLWVFRLVSRVNRAALIASRLFGAVVGLLSLLVAGFGIASYLSPRASAWSEGNDLAAGLVVMVLVAIGFIVAMGLSRRTAARMD